MGRNGGSHNSERVILLIFQGGVRVRQRESQSGYAPSGYDTVIRSLEKLTVSRALYFVIDKAEDCT